ncbi:SAM-dependent methyltransferase [Philodulcilactobacillus myokoensis]|uniref:SAM-dependent methyltransferase n=1 Tax=Philodulcilactobacillus myokoensis TaxID=2929573 RepID=A0A9W6B1W8_9LACO|nr:class I SAM-dependent methyltransferase [Philodulcilactobacillus myokoensis]GLB46903.1 SAM-dependent methyltransferase [Philodulcilactobacillus myokoensis]
MDGKHLSKRLQTVANQVPLNSRLADIGSDHAYLPIYLAQNHLVDFAVAGEVVRGPFQNAEYEINSANVNSIVHPRLADGLDAIRPSDDINVITIAGMGGNLIHRILERGIKLHRINGNEKLILQPNIGEYGLRKWLMEHYYQISDEKIVVDDHHIYEILIANKMHAKPFYTEDELYFGPVLLKKHSSALLQKYKDAYQRMQSVIHQMKFARSKQAKIKIQMIKAQMKLIQSLITRG